MSGDLQGASEWRFRFMIDFTSSIATIARQGESRKWLGAQIEQCRFDCLRGLPTASFRWPEQIRA
jgi:hypothetical protein